MTKFHINSTSYDHLYRISREGAVIIGACAETRSVEMENFVMSAMKVRRSAVGRGETS